MTITRNIVIAIIPVLMLCAFASETFAATTQKITTSKSTYTVFYENTVNLGAKAKTKLTYTSSNKSVATVNGSGVVKGIKAGTAKITIKAAKTSKYKAAQKTVTVNVVSGTAIIAADKSAEGWEYLKGCKIAIYKNSNGTYRKIRTASMSTGSATIKNLPGGQLYWAETPDTNYISTSKRVSQRIDGTYNGEKIRIELYALNKDTRSQQVKVKPNTGTLMINYDVNDYDIALHKKGKFFMCDIGKFDNGALVSGLAPGKYTVFEESNTKSRVSEVEIFPNTVTELNSPQRETDVVYGDFDLETDYDKLSESQKAYVDDAALYFTTYHAGFSDAEFYGYHKSADDEYVVMEIPDYGYHVTVKKVGWTWETDVFWVMNKKEYEVASLVGVSKALSAAGMRDSDYEVRSFAYSDGDEFVSDKTFWNEYCVDGKTKMNFDIFIYDFNGDLDKDMLKKAVSEYGKWEKENKYYGKTTFYVFKNTVIPEEFSLDNYRNYFSKDYRNQKGKASLVKSCTVTKSGTVILGN